MGKQCILGVLPANVAMVLYHPEVVDRVIMVPVADSPNLDVVESLPVVL